MRLSDFDFDLPERLIALRPVTPRDAARMLLVRPSALPGLADMAVRDLPDVLAPGDLMILNDTRVIPAQLFAVRERGGRSVAHASASSLLSAPFPPPCPPPQGGRVSVVPVVASAQAGQRRAEGPWTSRQNPVNRQPEPSPLLGEGREGAEAKKGVDAGEGHEAGALLAIAVTLHKRLDASRWLAFLKPGRRVKPGDVLRFGEALAATVEAKAEAGDVTLAFDRAGAALDAAIMAIGHMPLPPYIAGKRGEDAADATDYQTVYASRDGAVAAPTAGLHFTPELLAALDRRGVARRTVTLHVGAGTFLPVKVDDVSQHRMHAEWGEVSAETAAAINATRARAGRIVAVGTTSLRLIESAAEADGTVRAFSGDTSIFITPGYRFRAVDLLMTNFHLPKSTLFMLVSAFAGQDLMRKAYAHAIEAGYRFYSYGDSSLLERA